jgi:hypothetical protein
VVKKQERDGSRGKKSWEGKIMGGVRMMKDGAEKAGRRIMGTEMSELKFQNNVFWRQRHFLWEISQCGTGCQESSDIILATHVLTMANILANHSAPANFVASDGCQRIHRCGVVASNGFDEWNSRFKCWNSLS